MTRPIALLTNPETIAACTLAIITCYTESMARTDFHHIVFTNEQEVLYGK
jgi:hypothetical protein